MSHGEQTNNGHGPVNKIVKVMIQPILGAVTDIDGLITWCTTNSTAIVLIGVTLLAFAMGRKLLKKGT